MQGMGRQCRFGGTSNIRPTTRACENLTRVKKGTTCDDYPVAACSNRLNDFAAVALQRELPVGLFASQETDQRLAAEQRTLAFLDSACPLTSPQTNELPKLDSEDGKKACFRCRQRGRD